MPFSRRKGLGLLIGLAVVGSRPARATTYSVLEFLIYFPERSAEIPPASLEMVIQAQQYFDAARRQPDSRNQWLSLTGGVDGAEFSRGQQGLALDRARSVSRALEGLGVASTALYATSRKGPSPFEFGQIGKADQLNRAVIIELHFGMAPIAT